MHVHAGFPDGSHSSPSRLRQVRSNRAPLGKYTSRSASAETENAPVLSNGVDRRWKAEGDRLADRPAAIGIEGPDREVAAAHVSAADKKEIPARIAGARFDWPQ